MVTRLRYRLADVTRIAGGRLNYRGPGVGRVLERIIALEQEAPDELTMQVIARRWPDDGSLGLTLLVAWRGDAAGGAGDRISWPIRVGSTAMSGRCPGSSSRP